MPKYCSAKMKKISLSNAQFFCPECQVIKKVDPVIVRYLKKYANTKSAIRRVRK